MKRKITIALSAIALVALCAIGIFSFNHFSGNEALDTNLVVNTDGASSNGFFRLLATRKNAANIDKETVTITATVEPSYTHDATLKWTALYKSTGQPYLGNGDELISDVIEMTVAEDTMSVTIKYLGQFTDQIIVTATSNADATKSASCTLDCYKRTSDIKMNHSSTDGLHLNIECQDVSYDDIFNKNISFGTLTPATPTKAGTIDTTTSVDVQIKLHDDLVAALEEAGYTVDASAKSYGSGVTQGSASIKDFLLEKVTGASATDADFITVLNQTYRWFEVYTVVTDKYDTKTVNTITVDHGYFGYFNVSDFFSITSVTLDKSQIIF